MHLIRMRRILSIATVMALLSSLVSPVMAACMGTGKAISCHTEATPHCDRTMHHHHQEQAEATSEFALLAGDNDAKCPMDCCTPGHPQSGTALAAASLLPPLTVSDQNFHVPALTFISAGFSSHTDRGPPLV